jgi:hypothetical protein
MNCPVRADHFTSGPERLTKLIEEEDRLKRTIELVWQSIKSLEQSALSAERSKGGHLTSEREAWIRATVYSKDQATLDSLYLDLEEVTKQIATLAAQLDAEVVVREV